MAADLKELQALHVIDSLSEVCLGKDYCGSCEPGTCLIRYAQDGLRKCLKEKILYVSDGTKNIPHGDSKLYREEVLINGIANILVSCRSCQYEHFEDCIVSVIRNCYEIALFGDVLPYDGSNFHYLTRLASDGMPQADEILARFQQIKKARDEELAKK